jgi:hypothetical protein
MQIRVLGWKKFGSGMDKINFNTKSSKKLYFLRLTIKCLRVSYKEKL